MDKLYRLIGILFIFFMGYFAHKCTAPVQEKIEFIQGETIRDTIFYPEPFLVEIPADPILPMIPDTVMLPGDTILLTEKVDSTGIIQEFIKRKSYLETFYDNDLDGELIVGAEVQYNSLQRMWIESTPIIKKVTTIRERIFEPYGVVSANSLGYFGAGGGFFYRNTGLEMKYVTGKDDRGIEFGVKIKF